MRPLLKLAQIAVLLLFLAAARPAMALNCSAWVGPTMNFGIVNMLAGGTRDAQAPITYNCYGEWNRDLTVLLCISIQPDQGSGSYDPRHIASGNSRLAFNMYQDAARTMTVGSVDSGGSYSPIKIVRTVRANRTETWDVDVYGRIKTAGQEGLPAGTYTSNETGGWSMKLSYMEIASGTTAECSSPQMTHTPFGTFHIQAKIENACRIDSASDLNFGTVHGPTTERVDGASAFAVTCNTASYRLGMGDGLHADGTTRRMRGPAGTIAYELYSNPQRTQRWGSRAYNDDVGGMGNGRSQSWTVYGRVPAQAVPGPGEYADTVIITLSY